MNHSSAVPGDVFAGLLYSGTPAATAWVRGGSLAPNLSGMVHFYRTPYAGVLVEAEFFNLPNRSVPGATAFYAFHIHQDGVCDREPPSAAQNQAGGDFMSAGGHYNPSSQPHPSHAGDMLPLLGNEGYGWMAFYDKRFTIEEIMGRSVILHLQADDFTSQPAGNSGTRIGCGVIMPYAPR